MAFYQGSFGRGGGKEGFRRSQPFRRAPEPSLPTPNEKQEKLQNILINECRGELRLGAEPKPGVKDVRYLASYNWVDTAAATILVPGQPPTWLPPPRSQKLQEDADIYFRDPNSARYPAFPTEPAVRAILIQNPAIDTSTIDIFGCGNTFGSLLSYSRNEKRTFRFGVECIGGTVFLVRKTNAPREIIEEVRGYGHTFPERYTTWDTQVRRSASHPRIILYDFMDVKCVVRSECDGFIPDLISDFSTASHSQVEHSTHTTDFLNSKTLPLNIGPQTPVASPKLHIQNAGQTIPQAAIFDLKTRSIKSRNHSQLSMEEFYPRLWANQTPNFILALHDRGNFEPAHIMVKQVEAAVKEWEAENAELLKTFGGVLTKLISIARTKRDSRFEVRRMGTGPLEVWSEVAEWSALPEGVQLRWRLGGKNEDTNEEHGVDEGEQVGVSGGKEDDHHGHH